MQVPLGPSRFPTLVWHRAALVGLALLKFLTPPPPPRAGTDRDRPSLRASLLRPKLGTPRKLGSFRAPSIRRVLPVLLGGLLCAGGVPAIAQSIEAIRFISTPSGGPDGASNTVYIIDDQNPIRVEVDYDGNLPRDPGAPSLALKVGSATKQAQCSGSTSSDKLTCTYPVEEGDEAAAGQLTVGLNGLTGGDLPSSAYTASEVTPSSHAVDGIRLGIGSISVSGTSAGGFTTDDDIDVTINFVKAGTTDIEAVKGGSFAASLDFSAALDGTGNPRPTTLVLGAGQAHQLTFRYTVQAGDNTRAFGLILVREAQLRDTNGNTGLAPGTDPNKRFLAGAIRRVDTQGPSIKQVTIVNKAGTFRASKSNGKGAEAPIRFEVEYDERLSTVTLASLDVSVGQARPAAPCTHERNAFKLVCTLLIQSGWTDTDGLVTVANALRYTAVQDDLGNDAVPGFEEQNFVGHLVDAVAPVIDSVSITAPTANQGQNVLVTVTLTETAKVEGTPSARVKIEGGTSGGTADFVSMAGAELRFRYSLAAGDVDGHSGDSDADNTRLITLSSIDLRGVTDAAGNPSASTLPEQGTTATLTLLSDSEDITKPTVESTVLRNPPTTAYGIGDTIQVDVRFTEPVTLSNARLKLLIGEEGKEKEIMLSSSGRKALHSFRHRVAKGESDSDGIAVAAIELAARGSILDASRNGTVNRDLSDAETQAGKLENAPTMPATLTSAIGVDTVLPKIADRGVTFTPSSPAQDQAHQGKDNRYYFIAGETITATVTFEEPVTVDTENPPTLSLKVGTRTDLAKYSGDGSASASQTFEFVVEAYHLDRDGIEAVRLNKHTSIEDAAGNQCAANCEFKEWAGTQSSAHAVDGGDENATAPPSQDPSAPAPTVSPAGTPRVASSTAVSSSGYYTEGERIRIEIPMTTRVAYTSRPTLIVDFSDSGGGRVTANETPPGQNSFTGSILTFDYTVRPGDEGTISVTLNGQFTVEDGTRVVLGGARSLPSSYRVDARSPALDSVRITSNAGADDTYKAGETIIVTAEFTEPVVRTSRTADPTLAIEVGENSRPMTLQTPSMNAPATATWVFRYMVAADDNDADGVSIAANPLKGDLVDAAGNEATLTHPALGDDSEHMVDTKAPSIVGVPAITGHDNNLFVEGSTITATVTFDEEVDVTTTGSGAVEMRFNIGTGTGSEREARYVSGDGSEMLTFSYVVVEGDSGPLSVPADAIVGDVKDAAGNEAGVTPAVMSTPYTVDAAAPMLVGAPFITSTPPNGDTYATGDPITVRVGFDEPVVVDGVPRIYLTVGPKRRFASFVPGNSGADLTFSYTVRPGDMDDDGVSIAANELKLTSGATIKDKYGLSVASSQGTVAHPAVPDQSGHKVDAVAPGIESVEITSSPQTLDDAYLVDETIAVTVTFSEDIATDGTPTLDLMVGEGTDSRAAACAQGGAGTQLTCSYTVVANDFDADGISVDADMLEGTITDMVGNPATLTHEALEDDPAHKVYAAAPEAVRTIDRLSLAAGGGTNSLDLTGIFTGFQLSYAAVSSNESVATATVSGTDLTVVSGMEGTARVTVTASNLAGEASVSFDVLVATDPAETAVLNDALAAIGRSMLSSTASVIGSRFELASTGSQMALGGSRFGGSLSPQMQRFLAGNDPFALEERMSERALFSGSGSQQAYGGGYGLTADRLFTGTSFNMPLNAMGTGDAQFAVWGAGDLQSFEGEPDDGMYDGSSSSGYIGVDARGDGWLAGVSVSRSGAEADYDFDGLVEGRNTGGTLETSVTAFHPYARLEVGADSEVWVIGGFGGGEADLSRTHVTGSQSSDLSMAMAVGGLRRALAMEFGGADLSLRGDAGFLSLETDSGMMAVDGLSASVSRLRLGLEAAWEGESATPFVEVSGRFDGGDGQTGGGLELAGGLRILNPESGFGLEAKGRILAMHTGDGYSESGIGVTASFEPGAAGRGITFRLSPRWGGSADSTDLFWDEVGNVRDASQYAYGLDRAQTWGVDAALGYGFGLRSMPGVVTPFGQMDVTGDQDQRIRVGVRYGLMQGLLGGTQVELSAERVDGEMHRVGETRVLVSGRARF